MRSLPRAAVAFLVLAPLLLAAPSTSSGASEAGASDASVPRWDGGTLEARFELPYPPSYDCYDEGALVVPVPPTVCIDHAGTSPFPHLLHVSLRDETGLPVAAVLLFEDKAGEPLYPDTSPYYYPPFCGDVAVHTPPGWARLKVVQDATAPVTCAPFPGVLTEGLVELVFNPRRPLEPQETPLPLLAPCLAYPAPC
ncbi:MAG TPA: hypothetical protein VNZ52_08045 [Candidatus Thermoplasmatota archaeon]|nr:hypothetical protein [Candidatus Thermoplasmatota archaeon]